MWSSLYLSLGMGRDGEHNVQARTYVKEKMQNLSVKCINTSDKGKRTKILGYM